MLVVDGTVLHRGDTADVCDESGKIICTVHRTRLNCVSFTAGTAPMEVNGKPVAPGQTVHPLPTETVTVWNMPLEMWPAVENPRTRALTPTMQRRIGPAELLEISLFGGTDAETSSGAPSYFESPGAFYAWEMALRNVANWSEGQLALFMEDNPAAVKGCNLLPLDENMKADKSQSSYLKGARDLSRTVLVHLAQVAMAGQRGVAFLEGNGHYLLNQPQPLRDWHRVGHYQGEDPRAKTGELIVDVTIRKDVPDELLVGPLESLASCAYPICGTVAGFGHANANGRNDGHAFVNGARETMICRVLDGRATEKFELKLSDFIGPAADDRLATALRLVQSRGNPKRPDAIVSIRKFFCKCKCGANVMKDMDLVGPKGDGRCAKGLTGRSGRAGCENGGMAPWSATEGGASLGRPWRQSDEWKVEFRAADLQRKAGLAATPGSAASSDTAG